MELSEFVIGDTFWTDGSAFRCSDIGTRVATPKRERLLQRIIHIATDTGDLVLDSFAGSGTTRAVAHNMGRRWIMVERGEHCHTHIIYSLEVANLQPAPPRPAQQGLEFEAE